MPRLRGPSRTFRRYLLLEAPGWVLAAALLGFGVESFDLSIPIALLLLAAWIAKDLVLYPWLRDAYAADDPDASAALLGRIGEACDRLDRSGYVRLGSELWRAELAQGTPPVDGGGLVRVRAVHGLTLLVEPAQDASSGDAKLPGYGLSSPSRIA